MLAKLVDGSIQIMVHDEWHQVAHIAPTQWCYPEQNKNVEMSRKTEEFKRALVAGEVKFVGKGLTP